MTFIASKGVWLALTKEQRDELWILIDPYHCEAVRRWEDQLEPAQRCRGWRPYPESEQKVVQVDFANKPSW